MSSEMEKEGVVRPEETLDSLRLGGLKILQGRKGYRFSLDPVLLCAFARVGDGERVADLGTGSGIIPLLLARTTQADTIVGVEVQSSLADRARRNVVLNALESRVAIVEGDVRRLGKELPAGTFEVVVSNPPYRSADSGRMAPMAERAAARHELAGGLDDFLRAAAALLKEGGRFYIIYLADRLAELLTAMVARGLQPKRLRCVHSRPTDKARLALVEGRKGGRPHLAVEAPLFVYAEKGYSDEVLAMYGELQADAAPPCGFPLEKEEGDSQESSSS